MSKGAPAAKPAAATQAKAAAERVIAEEAVDWGITWPDTSYHVTNSVKFRFSPGLTAGGRPVYFVYSESRSAFKLLWAMQETLDQGSVNSLKP